MDWYDRPAPRPAAISEFRRLVAGLTEEYPRLRVEWDEYLMGYGFHLVRVRGPGPGPVLGLCLAGHNLAGHSIVWVARTVPDWKGWQSDTFDLQDPDCVLPLAALIYDFAREVAG